MDETTELQIFIDGENSRVNASIPKDFFTVKAMIQIIVRAMDVFYSQHYKGDDDNNSIFYEMGYIKALNYLIGPAINEVGWITTVVDDKLWNWANTFIIHCGKIALVERFQLYLKAGITRLSHIPEERAFHFTYISEDVDIENIDRKAADWYKKLLNDGFSKPNIDALLKEFGPIQNKLFSIVQPWLGHMIQYQYSDSDIDDYYQKLAYYRSASMFNQDLFPFESTFNGIPYAIFRDFAELNMAVSMKHKDFCEALIKKNETTNLPDIISLFCSRTETIQNAAGFLKLPVEVVKVLVDSLTLNLENKEYHVNREVSPAAPFIKIGADSLIQSSFGCEGNPYYFMNNELKRAFPNDYFKAVNEREQYFREQLYYIFDDNKYMKVNKSVIIKINRIHTDIDAAILNKFTGTLALFQLKWQDPFGKSMKQRNSRMKNFYPKTVEWIDKISAWIDQNDQRLVLSSLGFDRVSAYSKILLFVVNRNAAHFSGLGADKRVAWCTWYQVLNANSKIPASFIDDLDYLYNILTEEKVVAGEPHEQDEFGFSLSDIQIILKTARPDGV